VIYSCSRGVEAIVWCIYQTQASCSEAALPLKSENTRANSLPSRSIVLRSNSRISLANAALTKKRIVKDANRARITNDYSYLGALAILSAKIKVHDREGAITNTRGACAPQIRGRHARRYTKNVSTEQASHEHDVAKSERRSRVRFHPASQCV